MCPPLQAVLYMYVSIQIECYQFCSFLYQIYNEMIRDLLNPSSGILELREDHRGVNVVGLMEVETISVDEVDSLCVFGSIFENRLS